MVCFKYYCSCWVKATSRPKHVSLLHDNNYIQNNLGLLYKIILLSCRFYNVRYDLEQGTGFFFFFFYVHYLPHNWLVGCGLLLFYSSLRLGEEVQSSGLSETDRSTLRLMWSSRHQRANPNLVFHLWERMIWRKWRRRKVSVRLVSDFIIAFVADVTGLCEY